MYVGCGSADDSRVKVRQEVRGQHGGDRLHHRVYEFFQFFGWYIGWLVCERKGR